MSEIGKRLKEERERLGISQSVLAQRVGIHRNTQIKYESGERTPDATYLEAIGKVGVDVAYILGPNSGQRINSASSGNEQAATGVRNILAAYVELIYQIGQRIGSRQDATDRLANFPTNFSPVFWDGRSIPTPVVDAFFEGCSLEVDCDLLAAILAGLDAVLGERGTILAPAKKARAVAMLYRSFKASGKVDLAMIEEAVKLAAG